MKTREEGTRIMNRKSEWIKEEMQGLRTVAIKNSGLECDII